MSRFTLKDLFLATTLIGLGLSGLGVLWSMDSHALDALVITIYFGSFVCIGAGSGVLLTRQKYGSVAISVIVGSIVGLFSGFAVAFFIYAIHFIEWR